MVSTGMHEPYRNIYELYKKGREGVSFLSDE
jgi:hypothetical protein